MDKSAIFDYEIFENHHQFESVPVINEWAIFFSMQALFMKCYDAKYRIKYENIFFLSSSVFLYSPISNDSKLAFFANPANRGQFLLIY